MKGRLGLYLSVKGRLRQISILGLGKQGEQSPTSGLVCLAQAGQS